MPIEPSLPIFNGHTLAYRGFDSNWTQPPRKAATDLPWCRSPAEADETQLPENADGGDPPRRAAGHALGS